MLVSITSFSLWCAIQYWSNGSILKFASANFKRVKLSIYCGRHCDLCSTKPDMHTRSKLLFKTSQMMAILTNAIFASAG